MKASTLTFLFIALVAFLFTTVYLVPPVTQAPAQTLACYPSAPVVAQLLNDPQVAVQVFTGEDYKKLAADPFTGFKEGEADTLLTATKTENENALWFQVKGQCIVDQGPVFVDDLRDLISRVLGRGI